MDVLGGYLDERQERGKGHRPPAAWAQPARPEAERLELLDTWLRRQLQVRLTWPADPAKAARLQEQCRIMVRGMIVDLWRRGWLLDGRALAAHVTKLLDDVARQQEAGRVRDFWAYFKAAASRYVGLNAEEIQAEAHRGGAHVGAVMGAILAGQRGPATRSMTELVAQETAEMAAAKSLRTQRADRRDSRRKSISSSTESFLSK